LSNPTERLWTKSFITLTLCNLLLFTGLQMTLSTLPAYAEGTLHATSVQVSLVTSLFALSAIASRLFSAKAMEKGGRNLLIFLGLAILLAAVAGYYIAGSIAALLLLRMLFGVGFGMASTAFPTMASDVIPVRRMGEGMGYFGLSTSLAMSLPAQHKEPAISTVAASGGGAYRRLLLPCLLNFLLSISYGGLIGFLALFGAEKNLSHVAYFFLFNAVSIVIIRPLSGKIYDRFGPAALLIPGSLFIAGGLLLLSFASTTAALFPAALCYGFGFGSMQPALQTWMIQSVEPRQRGLANGMFFNSLDLGVAIGSMLLGAIALFASYAVMYRYSIVAPLLLLAVYLPVYASQRSRRRRAALQGVLGHTTIE
jgi:MFS family permease